MLGPFGVPGAERCILCSCLRYLAPLGVPGDAAWTVLVEHLDLLRFPLRIGV